MHLDCETSCNCCEIYVARDDLSSGSFVDVKLTACCKYYSSQHIRDELVIIQILKEKKELAIYYIYLQYVCSVKLASLCVDRNFCPKYLEFCFFQFSYFAEHIIMELTKMHQNARTPIIKQFRVTRKRHAPKAQSFPRLQRTRYGLGGFVRTEHACMCSQTNVTRCRRVRAIRNTERDHKNHTCVQRKQDDIVHTKLFLVCECTSFPYFLGQYCFIPVHVPFFCIDSRFVPTSLNLSRSP